MVKTIGLAGHVAGLAGQLRWNMHGKPRRLREPPVGLLLNVLRVVQVLSELHDHFS